MIKIISGHTQEGGSTEAFINLTNEFNRLGYPCTLYGLHEYPIGKCTFVRISGWKDLVFNPEDKIIVHYVADVPFRPNVDKFILSCHEQEAFPLKNIDLLPYDKIQFVSEHQREFHKVDWPSFIVGNIYENLHESQVEHYTVDNDFPLVTIPGIKTQIRMKKKKIGGIVGQIFPAKNTRGSIEAAIKDSCDEIMVCGMIKDSNYYDEIVKDFGYKFKYMGFFVDKQTMYDSFTDLYHYSPSECLSSVIAEAMITGKTIHTSENCNYSNAKYWLDKNEVIDVWKKELSL